MSAARSRPTSLTANRRTPGPSVTPRLRHVSSGFAAEMPARPRSGGGRGGRARGSQTVRPSSRPRRLLVTGGAGFMARPSSSHAGSDSGLHRRARQAHLRRELRDLEEEAQDPRFKFVQGDIDDAPGERPCGRSRCHRELRRRVARRSSNIRPQAFIATQVNGSQVLWKLRTAMAALASCRSARTGLRRDTRRISERGRAAAAALTVLRPARLGQTLSSWPTTRRTTRGRRHAGK